MCMHTTGPCSICIGSLLDTMLTDTYETKCKMPLLLAEAQAPGPLASLALGSVGPTGEPRPPSSRLQVAGSRQLGCYRLARGGRYPVSVPSCMYHVSRDFRNKQIGSAPPPPVPGAPPVLGSLLWSVEGLPSTRNWPFRWPLSPTGPPQVIPKAM
jgi:hypothetical protein